MALPVPMGSRRGAGGCSEEDASILFRLMDWSVALLVRRKSGSRINAERGRATLAGVDKTMRRFRRDEHGVAILKHGLFIPDLRFQFAGEKNKRLVAILMDAWLFAAGFARLEREQTALAALCGIQNAKAAAGCKNMSHVHAKSDWLLLRTSRSRAIYSGCSWGR